MLQFLRRAGKIKIDRRYADAPASPCTGDDSGVADGDRYEVHERILICSCPHCALALLELRGTESLRLHRSPAAPIQLEFNSGGEGGIRTLEPLAGLTVFKTVAIDHSATSPLNSLSYGTLRVFRYQLMSQNLRLSLLRTLGVTEQGLDDEGVHRRREASGYNEIPPKKESILKLILSQFQDTMVYILLVAAAVSVLVPYVRHGHLDSQELTNAIVILAIVILNAILGFTQEWRAENAIAMLASLSAPRVKVRRGGKVSIIPSRELVPGDIILVEAGDKISADARLIATSSLEVDEASLTGESLPVAKSILETIKQGTMSPGILYCATLVTRGFGEAVVTGIGLQTEIGKITSMVMSLKPPPTPLELELQRAGKKIGIVVLGLCTLIFAAGILSGMEITEIFFTAVSLAVAAVPEGLPAVVTICLAVGVQRMIKKNALIRRLDAVETLGSITVICADKTGTITENRMVVQHVWTPSGGSRALALEIGASCNRSELPDIGDPTEVALLRQADSEGVSRLPLLEEEVPFTSEGKYMVTIHEKNGQRQRYMKGAPEVIARFLPPEERDQVLSESMKLSKLGLRVLASAYGSGQFTVCAGLIAMMDPPRSGVTEAIFEAKTAGIRTIMITGDHPATALTVAESVGLVSDGVIDGEKLESMDTEDLQHALKTVSVFARVQPVHKVKILEALQGLGHIVAMSGDGVNDAPALKRAHVGIAMGLNGTDIAREAGAMVLTDDNFATIVAAIEEGRRIYDNIKKFVIFLMRSNLGEVMMISGAMLLGMPLPLLPLHILWVNLVTDSFPALALAVEDGEHGIMQRMPRKKGDGIFTGEWPLLILAGLLNAALSLGLFSFVRSIAPDNLVLARTVALTSTILFQMLLSISTRTKAPIFFDSPLRNLWLIAAIAFSLFLHSILLLTPIGVLFGVTAIPLRLLTQVLAASVLAFLIFECVKWAKYYSNSLR